MSRPQLHYLKSITLGTGPNKETCDLEYYWLVEYDNVAQAAVELPSLISWLNYHYAEACERASRYERVYNETESEVYFQLRGGDFTQLYGDGKVTEKALDRAVITDPRVKEAAVASEQATKLAQTIKGQLAALQAKLDLIRTSEATRRRVHEPMPADREEIPDEAVDVPHQQRRNRNPVPEEEDQS